LITLAGPTDVPTPVAIALAPPVEAMHGALVTFATAVSLAANNAAVVAAGLVLKTALEGIGQFPSTKVVSQ